MASPVLTPQTLISSSASSSSSFSSSILLRRVHTASSLSLRSRRFGSNRGARSLAIRAETMATEKLGIKVERNPPDSRLDELGVRQWPKWGCPPSKFPWTYTAKETCYLLEGKVKVFPDGHGNDYMEIQAGDLVEFPRGMKCTWDVSVAVDKHYNFE
ncbi:hypothetical protein ACMD2_11903 [Ananas comosus]|uniref:(S)-ureidoglycine aminohydrolase cupin domain-containing protein n=1 Tax=Ananas comosus TaxID=4615 RepID=A0A199UJN8_ANACO|nr:hypothetical protein ACMD2_11903 [Ananas comosus]